MPDYLLATVNTDTDPYRGEFAGAEIVTFADAISRLSELLGRHGHAGAYDNAQMIEEAETATAQLARWRGFPMRLCGYLTRYDVYPTGDLALVLPLQDLWTELAAWYEQRTRDRSAAGKCHGLGISPDDADYREVRAWLAQYESYDAGMRARDLTRFHDLALRADVAPHLAAYRPWQWALATVITGDSYELVERELLREIASREASR